MTMIGLITLSIKPGHSAPFEAIFRDGTVPPALRDCPAFACEVGEVNTLLVIVPRPDGGDVGALDMLREAAAALAPGEEMRSRIRSTEIELLRPRGQPLLAKLAETPWLLVHHSSTGTSPMEAGDFERIGGVTGRRMTLSALGDMDEAIEASLAQMQRTGGWSELHRRIS